MARNLGRKFATMDEDERRRFAMQSEGGTDSAPDKVSLENPRNRDTLGTPETDAGGDPADDEPEQP